MTDLDALRAAVQQSPHDWTPRLVLADYLDDTGEPHHAEEAARIRQAADPSTPLGRAVAASRRAWGLTKDGPRSSRPKESAGIVSHEVDGFLHDAMHGTRNEQRDGLMNAGDSHWWHGRLHDHARSSAVMTGLPDDEHHEAARDAHATASRLLHEHARTIR